MSLNQLFDQLIGATQNPTGDNQSPKGGLSSLTDNIPGGMMGGLAAGGLLGVLVGNKKMRKTAGKLAGGAVGLGGAAILGAVAYSAYKNWQTGGKATPESPAAPVAIPSRQSVPSVATVKEAGFDPQSSVSPDGKPFQLALIKAMIAAANADGHIDRDEQQAVFDAVGKFPLDTVDKAIVFDTLQNPPSLDEIAGLASGMEQASELYLVSRMAIDPDLPSEKAYLSDLASKLQLPEGLVLHLERQLDEFATEPA